MVLIAESEADLQLLLDHMYDWCYKWRLSVNRDKTKIVHFRQPRQSKTQYGFRYGLSDIEIVSQYKYLGIIMDEYLKCDRCTTTLSNAGSRALSAIISKFKSILSNTCMIVVWHQYWNMEVVCGTMSSLRKSKLCKTEQWGFFLVHRFAPIAGIIGDMGWTRPSLRRYLCMLRLWNRLLIIDDNRITKKIFLWSLRDENMWAREIKNVFEMLDLSICYESVSMCDSGADCPYWWFHDQGCSLAILQAAPSWWRCPAEGNQGLSEHGKVLRYHLGNGSNPRNAAWQMALRCSAKCLC